MREKETVNIDSLGMFFPDFTIKDIVLSSVNEFDRWGYRPLSILDNIISIITETIIVE